ncbi:MAG: nicotinamide mononucleotide transporter [Clostridia bacterium]|nr:nicotinamide mononucleotide transporter [Clostridia bacterium]
MQTKESKAVQSLKDDTQKRASKKIFTELFPIAITGILLIACSIVFKQKFIKLLPTLVSLIVMLLSARVSRFAFLLGGLNSALYSVGYFMERLYPSAVSALAFSFPIQIASFILWSKNQTEKKEVKVRRLNKKSGSVLLVASVAGWIVSFLVYRELGTKSLVLDNTIFVLGILITVMQMLRFIESPFLNVISLMVGIVQWTVLTIENTANINYLIYHVYCFYFAVVAIFEWIRIYKGQITDEKRNNTLPEEEQSL